MTGKTLMEEIVAGLEELPGGAWKASQTGLTVLVWAEAEKTCVVMGRKSDVPIKHATHIARCSPDNIRAIAEYVHLLEEENKKLREASEWKPIETAPISNGSNAFMTYIPGHGCSVCYAGAGRFIYSITTGERIHRATHWMPLPSAPLPLHGRNSEGGEG